MDLLALSSPDHESRLNRMMKMYHWVSPSTFCMLEEYCLILLLETVACQVDLMYESVQSSTTYPPTVWMEVRSYTCV